MKEVNYEKYVDLYNSSYVEAKPVKVKPIKDRSYIIGMVALFIRELEIRKQEALREKEQILAI